MNSEPTSREDVAIGSPELDVQHCSLWEQDSLVLLILCRDGAVMSEPGKHSAFIFLSAPPSLVLLHFRCCFHSIHGQELNHILGTVVSR